MQDEKGTHSSAVSLSESQTPNLIRSPSRKASIGGQVFQSTSIARSDEREQAGLTRGNQDKAHFFPLGLQLVLDNTCCIPEADNSVGWVLHELVT